jgi:SAM-dependent methyltransferase
MQANTVPAEFNPNIGHPYYFIRKALYSAISENAHNLTGNLMDFGCGSKPYQSLFTSADSYLGVDYQGEGHSHETENIDVYYDGKTIPFANSHFDSILCSEVFEHLFNLEEILQELNRVLKPGGKMLITCPFAWNIHEQPIDYARYTPFALVHLFTKAGFKVIKQDRKGNFFETLAQLTNVYLMGSIFAQYNGKSYQAKPYIYWLQKPVIFLHNIFAKIGSNIMPKRTDYYMVNVFLVEKA